MNKRLFRTQFNQMENIEKQVLMESLAARYDMTFLGLHTFDRWSNMVSAQIWIRMRMEALAPWQMSCGSPPSGISGGIDGRCDQ